MAMLDINFSQQAIRHRRRRDGAVLVISAIIMLFVFSEYLTNRQQIQTLSQSQQQSGQTVVISQPTEQEQAQHKLATALASSLNIPWFEMLSAIESAKQQNPDVFLKTIRPDVRKGEIQLSGEVKKLQQLLAFMDALNEQEIFHDVLPLSQQEKSEGNRNMAFTLKVGWQTHE